MPLNCENALKAYVQLFDLLTVRQRTRLLEIALYVNDINKLGLQMIPSIGIIFG